MRRKDREINDPTIIDAVIGDCQYCRLGFCDEGEVYIVPMNFGFAYEGRERVFYFHCATEGRKLELIEKNDYIGFELDTGYRLNGGDTACDYSAAFKSIIGNGNISVVNDPVEKTLGMQAVMRQCTGKNDWVFDEKIFKVTRILKLVISKLSCKEHL